LNRFNGLFGAGETVETVIALSPAVSTPLKWGVNEMSNNRPHSEMRAISGVVGIATCG